MRRTRFVHDVLIRYDPFREGLNQRPGPQARVDGFCRTISEACLYARWVRSSGPGILVLIGAVPLLRNRGSGYIDKGRHAVSEEQAIRG